MFDIEQNRRFDDTQRMLFNIMTTLFEIKERLPIYPSKTTDVATEIQKIEETFELPVTENVKPKTVCAYCGGTHDNKGQALACARKSQKK